MLEFIYGYVLGSSARDSTPMSGKAIAIIILVLMALVGTGYMMLPMMFPESVPQSAQQCGGERVAAMMCNLAGIAKTVGMVFVGLVALVVVGWVWIASAASRGK